MAVPAEMNQPTSLPAAQAVQPDEAVILREVAGSTRAKGVVAGVDPATARRMTPGRASHRRQSVAPVASACGWRAAPCMTDMHQPTAVPDAQPKGVVILREVAGSTLANGVAAGVDPATARRMTPGHASHRRQSVAPVSSACGWSAAPSMTDMQQPTAVPDAQRNEAVILREVAGSTLAKRVLAGLDPATARRMTPGRTRRRRQSGAPVSWACGWSAAPCMTYMARTLHADSDRPLRLRVA